MLITTDNFKEYCKKHYKNPHCLGEKEFLQDLKTLKYIKTSFRKYITKNDLSPTIMLNHFIYFQNCFGSEAIPTIMFFDFCDYYYPLLKTVFYYMGILPEEIHVHKLYIKTSNIQTDINLYKSLINSKTKNDFSGKLV